MESYRTIIDSSMNNLAHLAGKLAPSFVLGRTTGSEEFTVTFRTSTKKYAYADASNGVRKRTHGFNEARRKLDENNSGIMQRHCCINCHGRICSSNHCTWRKQSRIRHPIVEKTICLHYLCCNQCILTIYSRDRTITILINPHYKFTKKVDFWSFDIIPLYNFNGCSLWCNLLPCLL